MWKSLALLCMVASSSCDESEWREVQTAQGVVRGLLDPNFGLYTFYNIPYATVPTGADRYKAPLPPPIRSEPLDAGVDRGIICIQTPTPFLDIQSKTMQEDCLIANIYVPDTEDRDLPVMVYVHGGAFEIGYGNMLPPKYLVKQNKLIVVNFNYRLGVHGFLCLGTNNAPGNAGLKDQLALLHWVKENIANFGGNPEEVTIAGGSAGSISVDLLMLSKSAEGLFNKVIPESGASVGSLSVQLDPLDNAKYYAKMLNFTDVDDFHALEEFYLNTPLQLLLQNTLFQKTDGSLIFAPCVERKTDAQIFLDDTPVNIIRKGEFKKVPILIGINNMEGLIAVTFFSTWKDSMNEKFSDFLPGDLHFENEEKREEISRKVQEFYFGDSPVAEETILAFIDYYTDVLFAYSTLRTVKLHAEVGHDQIFLYEYSFADNSTPVVPFTNVRGAMHGAQSVAVLDGAGDESQISMDYQQMKTTIRDMWYNFVVHSEPVPQGSSLPAWPVSGASGGPYMSLGQPVEMRGILLEQRARFWEDIYQQYYQEPVPPPEPSKASAILVLFTPFYLTLILTLL